MPTSERESRFRPALEEQLKSLSPIQQAICRFIAKYGPVTLEEIVVGGKKTGHIRTSYSSEEIIAATIKLHLNSDLVAMGGKYRLRRPDEPKQEIFEGGAL